MNDTIKYDIISIKAKMYEFADNLIKDFDLDNVCVQIEVQKNEELDLILRAASSKK